MKAKQIIEQAIAPVRLEESSLSRVWQHIVKPGSRFAVISAYLPDLSQAENRKRQHDLVEEARKRHYGVTHFKSGYEYARGEHAGETAEEESVMVNGISKPNALALAARYGQETIIYRDDTEFSLLSAKSEDYGKVVINFLRDRRVGASGSEDVLTFNPVKLKSAFSSLTKANKSNRADFAFVPESFAVWHLPVLQGFANYLRVAADNETL